MTSAKTLLFAVCFGAIFGCATMFDGTKQTISVNSHPPGAEVIYNGQPLGVTPLSTQVPRRKDPTLVIQKEGYVPQSLVMTSTLTSTFIWADIVVGGILLGILPGAISTTVDAADGAIYEYSPSNFMTSLQPVYAAPAEHHRAQRQSALLRFCLTSFDHLKDDIARGSGEYLSALCEMSGVGTHCWQKPDYGAALIQQHDNPMSFAMAAATAL